MKHCWQVFWTSVVQLIELLARVVSLGHLAIDAIERSMEEDEQEVAAPAAPRRKTAARSTAAE